jgi:hypothetical protein
MTESHGDECSRCQSARLGPHRFGRTVRAKTDGQNKTCVGMPAQKKCVRPIGSNELHMGVRSEHVRSVGAWLVGPVHWLASLGDGPMGPSRDV